MCYNTDMEQIKTLRQKLGLTQAQLADKLGIKHSSVSRWEDGSNKPSYDSLKRLCGWLIDVVLGNGDK